MADRPSPLALQLDDLLTSGKTFRSLQDAITLIYSQKN